MTAEGVGSIVLESSLRQNGPQARTVSQRMSEPHAGSLGESIKG